MKKTFNCWVLLALFLLLSLADVVTLILLYLYKYDIAYLAGFFSSGAILFLVLFIIKLVKYRNRRRFANRNSNPSSSYASSDWCPDIVTEFDRIIKLNLPELPNEDWKCPLDLYNNLEKEIKLNKKPNVLTLQMILISMEKHLGLKDNKSIIVLEKLDDSTPGYIEKHDYSFNEITLSYREFYNANCYIGVLAHELSHAYQYSKRVENLFADRNKQEKFTDALTFYLGFGEYTEKGKTVTYKKFVEATSKGNKYLTTTYTLGYLESSSFVYFEEKVEECLNQKKKTAEENKKNKALISQIDESLNSITIYKETIDNQINELKNKKLSDEQVKYVQDYLLNFGDDYLNNLKSSIGDYKRAGVAANQNTLDLTTKQLKELITISLKIDSFTNK